MNGGEKCNRSSHQHCHPAYGGRPRIDDRRAFAAMIYVLRTGIQWNAEPMELGASSTVHDRFQEWEKQHFFQVLWQAGLAEYDEVQGIEWEWQSVDGAMTKAQIAQRCTWSQSNRSRQEGNQTQSTHG